MIILKNLSPKVKELLLYVHEKHTSTMDQENKDKHSLENIKKVVVEKYCLKVYYEHEWYHYTTQGTWY